MPELPEELVEGLTGELFAEPGADDWEVCRRLAVKLLNSSPLSSILERLERALAVAEKFEKEAREARWAQKQAEEQVWRLTDELADTRLSGGPVAATPPTGNDGHETAEALPPHREADCPIDGCAVCMRIIDVVPRAELEAAEGERAYNARVATTNAEIAQELRGERDRLRELCAKAPHAQHCEAGASLFPGKCNCWKARAALSTGDRQEQHSGGTGAGAPQTGLDGHDPAAALPGLSEAALEHLGVLLQHRPNPERLILRRLTTGCDLCEEITHWSVRVSAAKLPAVEGED